MATPPENCHDAKFIVTGGTGGCRFDNLRCRQWRLNCHHYKSRLWLMMNFPVLNSIFDKLNNWFMNHTSNDSKALCYDEIYGNSVFDAIKLQIHFWWERLLQCNRRFKHVYPLIFLFVSANALHLWGVLPLSWHPYTCKYIFVEHFLLCSSYYKLYCKWHISTSHIIIFDAACCISPSLKVRKCHHKRLECQHAS